VGGALCEREGIDWLDLSGNARITRPPRTRIIVEGRAPASRPRGRQRDLFATKSSRLAHWLLLNADQAHSHQQLVEATGLDKGHLSRLLSRMEELRLISRQGGGIRLTRPDVMLDAWRESYKPPCGQILKGVVPSRSGQETMERVGSAMEASGIRHAFGGLAAAWAWDGYADFRLATCYLEGGASADLLRDIGFVETERGANLWLMAEADRVALLGRQQRNGVCVASPWFTYADLLIHPERAADASSHLRQHVLKLEPGSGA
jgi:hypothetical protein